MLKFLLLFGSGPNHPTPVKLDPSSNPVDLMIMFEFDSRNPHIKATIKDIQTAINKWIPEAYVLHFELIESSSSNTNFHVEINLEPKKVILRSTQSAISELSKEATLYKNLWRSLPVPRLLFENHQGPGFFGPYIIMSEIEGSTLNKLLTAKFYHPDLAENLGRTLGMIHKKEFSKAGYFTANFIFLQKFDNYGEHLIQQFHSHCEDKLLVERLGKKLTDEVQAYVRNYESQLLSIQHCSQLLHGDFNPHNIIVDLKSKQVAGIVDWEKSFSGPGLIDVGHFLRYESLWPQDFTDAFISGYGSSGASLENDWYQKAKLLDLLLIFSYLKFPKNRPSLFQEIKEFLLSTLKSD